MKRADSTPKARPAAELDQTPARATPEPEAVAELAYALYVARGCLDGCDVDDWLEAERQLCCPAEPAHED